VELKKVHYLFSPRIGSNGTLLGRKILHIVSEIPATQYKCRNRI